MSLESFRCPTTALASQSLQPIPDAETNVELSKGGTDPFAKTPMSAKIRTSPKLLALKQIMKKHPGEYMLVMTSFLEVAICVQRVSKSQTRIY